MRIDVQTHLVPESYVRALEGRKVFPRYERAGEIWWAWASADEKLPMGPKALDIDLKIAEMDENGIDLSLISLNIPGPDLAADPKDAEKLARIGNDGIAEACSRHPGRLRGFANLGLGDVESSCRELERCIDELGFVALQMFAYIGGRRFIDDPVIEPLWGLLEGKGIPLVLHPGPSPSSPVYKDHWIGPAIGFIFDECLAALRLILGGVLERYSGLRVLLPHGGASLPFFIGRVDNLHGRHGEQAGTLPRKPSHYFRRFHTDSVAHSKEALAFAVQQMGVDKLMFASDAPWVPISNHVKIVEALALAPAEAEKVWSGNARTFFGL